MQICNKPGPILDPLLAVTSLLQSNHLARPSRPGLSTRCRLHYARYFLVQVLTYCVRTYILPAIPHTLRGVGSLPYLRRFDFRGDGSIYMQLIGEHGHHEQKWKADPLRQGQNMWSASVSR